MREDRFTLSRGRTDDDTSPGGPGDAGAAATPLVGRDYELMTVEEVLDQASVQVIGPPGSGVSAVVEAVADRRRAAGHAVLVATVAPWAAGPPRPLDQVDALLPHLDSPTVVVDDAQLVPVEDLEALRARVEGRGGRLLLGLHPGTLPDLDVVHLPGLTRDHVRQLLAGVLGRPVGSSDELLVAALSRATRGHVSHVLALLEPPLLRPLAALAADQEDLDPLRTPFADALASDTRARLSTLDQPSRLAASIVAVAGARAPAALLDAASGVEQLAPTRVVGLLERVGDGHRYRNAAVRDLVRRSLPAEVLAESRWRLGVAAQATGLHHAPAGVF